MSADVDMLPRQWDNETKNHCDEASAASNQIWERNLIMKRMHQHKNGVLLEESSDASETNSCKSVFERGAMVSYFYPAVESKSTSRVKENIPKPSLTSQESNRENDVEESILPVHQNPILLQDLERRSKDLAPPKFKFSNWRNSTEGATAFPADTSEEFVFVDSSKCKEDSDTEEVVYGRGFVHRLLMKFSSLAHQEEPSKNSHKTSPKTKFRGMYDSEPSLASKSEHKARISSPERTLKEDVGSEDKSMSDGEEKIEPVLNTLCMFEKLFCGRKKSQEEHSTHGCKPSISLTKPTLRKFSPKPSVPTKTIFVSKCKLHNPVNTDGATHHSASTRDVANIPIASSTTKEAIKTKFNEREVKNSHIISTEMRNLNVAEVDMVTSPVKLVKSLFESASSIDQIVKSDVSRETKIGPGKCLVEPTVQKQNVNVVSSGVIFGSAVNTTMSVSSSIIINNSSMSVVAAITKSEGESHQLRQHKRHSSKDYLEIRQSDKITDEYKEVTYSKNDKKVQNSSSNSQTKMNVTVARPGKLLIRSSSSTSSVDVLSLPKYNDIRTGEFIPASKACIDDDADDDDDKDFDYEFEGGGVNLERSMLAKTKDAKKLKILFDDATTTTHEYPSEQSLIDWFNDQASANMVRDAMFFI